MYSVVLAAALTAGATSPAWGCHGCHGCSGCAYNAFSYGCHGCWGCHGCSGGCWGGCYGGCWGGGCYGCYGSVGCYGCWGCYGGVSYASCYGCQGAPGVEPAHPKRPPSKEPKGEGDAQANSTRAEIVVQAPAGTRLYVDGAPTNLDSPKVRVVTPDLEPGVRYAYSIRAVANRAGQPVEQTRRVVFRAGDVLQVRFDNLKEDADASARRD